MDWESLLPEPLLKTAYVAGLERAWKRQDALQVIEILSSQHYVVLGVDVWLPTSPGPSIPTPFVYDWSLQPDVPNADHPKTAIEFVRTFVWDASDASVKRDEPYFNILARLTDS